MAVVYAFGTLTNVGADFAAAETVTIGGKVYTFQTSLTNVDGNVKVAASVALTLQNLFFAIQNSGGVPGTDYANNMTVNPHVVSAVLTATTLKVTSKVGGAIGNFVPTIKTSAGGAAWGGAVLASGTGSCYDDLKALMAGSPSGMGANVQQILIDLSDPLNVA
jgi:hypothetical protein